MKSLGIGVTITHVSHVDTPHAVKAFASLSFESPVKGARNTPSSCAILRACRA